MNGSNDLLSQLWDRTNGGLDIYAELIEGFKDGRRTGYLNPAYEDSKGSLSIYERGGKFRHHDFGSEDYKGDAIDLYAQVHKVDVAQAIKDLCSRYGILQGNSRPAPKRAKTKRQRAVRYEHSQGVAFDPEALVAIDRPTLLTDHLYRLWGSDGRKAAALYCVGRRPDDHCDVACLPYVDAWGRICAVKLTKYREANGSITKKREDGKGAMFVRYENPEIDSRRYTPAFGEHLVTPTGPRKHVVLVEAEDGALTAQASRLWPKVTFMAMGGLRLNEPTAALLWRHRVQILPDAGKNAEDRARAIADRWRKDGRLSAEVVRMEDTFNMVRYRDRNGSDAAEGADVRDVLEDALRS